jgi:hypothetical protein
MQLKPKQGADRPALRRVLATGLLASQASPVSAQLCSFLGWVYGAQELHELVTDLGRGLVLYPVAHAVEFETPH